MEKRIRELQGKFDTQEPDMGHFDRFQKRLAKVEKPKPSWNPHTWKWIAVAASMALLVGFWFGGYKAQESLELADISPEMEETQSFFVSTIQYELNKINIKRNESNKEVIEDALSQLEILEKSYKELTLELGINPENRTLIFSMISNFQTRIEILQNLLEQLDEIQQLKTQQNEKTII